MDQSVILSIGTLCFDVIGTVDGAIPQSSITARLKHLRYEDGGRAANFTVYAAMMGARPAIVARVGKDFRDGGYWHRLRGMGVNVDLLYHQMDTLTPRTFIYSNPQDMTLYFYPAFENGAHEEGFVKYTETLVRTAAHDAVYATSETPEANLVALASSAARLKVFAPAHDIGRHSVSQLSEALGAADWLIANQIELEMLCKLIEKRPDEIVQSFGLQVLAATAGAAGVDLLTPGGTVHLAAYHPRTVADPTGAGDAFAGALVAEYLTNGDLVRSARTATALASFVVEQIGCQIDPPAPQEIADREKEISSGSA
jgi:Sugar kinases, ribokinase family